MSPDDLTACFYEVFRCFPKPDHSTRYQHCGECMYYDELLRPVSNRDLSVEQIGVAGWGPVAFLTPDAMAYFLPRLMELAVHAARNVEGSSFIQQFLNQIGLSGRADPQFSKLGSEHVDSVRRCLDYIAERYGEEIAEECCEDWLAQALEKWCISS